MVKKGYKQTEIGVLPEEWTISTIGTIADVKTGPFGSALHADDYVQDGTPIITVEHLGETGLIRQNLPKVSDEDRQRLSAYSMQEGDIVFSRVGSVDRNAYVTAAENGWLFSGRILRLRAKSEKLSTRYLGYYFKSEDTKERIRGVAVGQTMASLNTKLMNAFKVVLPTVEEQKNIATLLSNIDTLISTLEKQVSKKKAIKQGAMQELLTGKRRLPGFNGAWREVRLEDICSKITDGSHESPPESDVGYYMPSVKDMTSTGFDYSECKKISYADFKKLERNGCRPDIGDVLIAKDGSILKYAFVQEQAETIVILSSIAIVKPLFNCVDSFFLAQYFRQQNFVEQVITNYKSGTGVPRIVLKGFKQIELFIPESVAEQATIAKILVDMDKEIAGLEKKLGKYRQVKQGMMQQLLTGKIRLTKDIEDSVQAEQVTSEKAMTLRPVHNHQFDDAVAIAAIVDAFYSDKYPLGRVKVQKLLYLLHRHQGVSVSDFKKKAAGPYADTVRYKGGEPIAKKNKYIVSESGKQGTRYSKGTNMGQALDYVERWGMQADLQWLKENFLHTSRNDLELFATVDMAMCDLDEVGISVSVESIKNLIASNKEWKAKLSKTYFSDWDIARAIKKCTELFN